MRHRPRTKPDFRGHLPESQILRAAWESEMVTGRGVSGSMDPKNLASLPNYKVALLGEAPRALVPISLSSVLVSGWKQG